MPKNVSHRRKSLEQQSREHEYYKVRSRIQHRLSRYRVQGYDISSINVPAIPKRITEGSINRLSKITPAYIRKHSKVAVAVDIHTGEATKTVSGEKFYKEKQKESRRKAVETRKRRRAEASNAREDEHTSNTASNRSNIGSSSRDDSDIPFIGDLMYQKIEDLISQYNMEGSSLGKTIQGWLNDAIDDGTIDRLVQITTDQLNDLEQDIRYAATGKAPKYNGINALHWALTNKNLTAEEWSDIQEAYDADAGADKFDEESFYNSDPYGFDDDDDY